MEDRFEFRRQTFSQKFWLYAARAILIWIVGIAVYALGTIRPVETDSVLLHAGGIFVAIWAYSNVVQAKTEIQELFVPPFQLDNATECLVLGIVCTTLSWFI